MIAHGLFPHPGQRSDHADSPRVGDGAARQPGKLSDLLDPEVPQLLAARLLEREERRVDNRLLVLRLRHLVFTRLPDLLVDSTEYSIDKLAAIFAPESFTEFNCFIWIF